MSGTKLFSTEIVSMQKVIVQENGVCSEKLCEVETSAKCTQKNLETQAIRGLSGLAKFLREKSFILTFL